MTTEILEIDLETADIPAGLTVSSFFSSRPGPDWIHPLPCYAPAGDRDSADQLFRRGYVPELPAECSEDWPADRPARFRIAGDERLPEELPAAWTFHFQPSSARAGLAWLASSGLEPARLLVSDRGLCGSEVRRLTEAALLLSEARRLYRVGRIAVTADDPWTALRRGREILRSAGDPVPGVRLVSCPTCSRCQLDLIELATRIWRRVSPLRTVCTVAVMGCEVNGPGEAAHCQLGVAGGRGRGLLFRHGNALRTLPAAELEDALIEEIERLTGENCLPKEV